MIDFYVSYQKKRLSTDIRYDFFQYGSYFSKELKELLNFFHSFGLINLSFLNINPFITYERLHTIQKSLSTKYKMNAKYNDPKIDNADEENARNCTKSL
ncbi:hypothetical protein BpHYR1_005332 [Brachionus plicatilis]|uniref:Uncharacterized protein n=1 Tax=Brachionus plicatilis TaxID=10195 RepID=A0A3M7RUF8_BRAPC|nr:hypothetical protein BpHYR1_005332 [Brachionus plicatilis]